MSLRAGTLVIAALSLAGAGCGSGGAPPVGPGAGPADATPEIDHQVGGDSMQAEAGSPSSDAGTRSDASEGDASDAASSPGADSGDATSDGSSTAEAGADGGSVTRADIVVYGATAAGVIAAVAAAREGARVVLVEPGRHVGGMVSGGLGWTDFGNKAVIGGMSLGFFQRAGKKYNTTIAWTFEPHVAEAIFQELLAAEANLTVVFGQRLRERTGVEKSGTRLLAMHTEGNVLYEAKVFLDATYEGDLMAQAKVSYTWGREATAQYGESLAGVRDTTPKNQFTVDVSPYAAGTTLLPLVQMGPKGAIGSADQKVQAYNFRLCLTDTAANRVPFARPASYDANRYALVARLIAALAAKSGAPPKMADLLKVDRVQNGKTDVNNQGAVSTDHVGASWDYPEGDYATRQKIWDDHRAYTEGLLYFLANDPQVPAALRAEVGNWGLSRDEFVDNGNWPHQLYVREARRMVGEYVMSQKDIQTELTKPDSIGMGSYNSDSHNVERIPTAGGFVENEGDMQVPVQPYQIPFRIVLPKRAEATNLIVPVAFSATHVAYSTLRMEPQYMIIGQAAGLAAKMALDASIDAQLVDVAALQTKLRAANVVLSFP